MYYVYVGTYIYAIKYIGYYFVYLLRYGKWVCVE